MDIVVSVPDHKFKVGDFVRFTQNRYISGFLVIGQVYAVVGSGGWYRYNSDMPIVNAEEYCYHVACQEGCLKTDGSPLRPGTIIMPDVEELDEIGQLVQYDGKVWEPDSPDNIDERWNNETL